MGKSKKKINKEQYVIEQSVWEKKEKKLKKTEKFYVLWEQIKIIKVIIKIIIKIKIIKIIKIIKNHQSRAGIIIAGVFVQKQKTFFFLLNLQFPRWSPNRLTQAQLELARLRLAFLLQMTLGAVIFFIIIIIIILVIET